MTTTADMRERLQERLIQNRRARAKSRAEARELDAERDYLLAQLDAVEDAEGLLRPAAALAALPRKSA